VIGVQEVQDNTGRRNGRTNDGMVDASATSNRLIEAIKAAGGPRYQFRDIPPVYGQDGGEPGGNIRVGFLFRTDRGLDFVARPGGDATPPVELDPGPAGLALTLSPGRIDPLNPAFAS